MRINKVNGARTPKTIYNELQKVGKLVGAKAENKEISYQYFTIDSIEKDSKAIEVMLVSGEAFSIRYIEKGALKYLIPDFKEEPISIGYIHLREDPTNIDTNFKFGGF